MPVMAHPDLYRLMDGPYVPRYIDDAGAFLSQQTCNYSLTHSTVVSVRSWLARDYFISWEARPVVSVSRLFGRDSQQLPTVMAWTFAAETRQSILDLLSLCYVESRQMSALRTEGVVCVETA